jgi:indolepyruvate ferredoxin oxidoreductase
MLAGRSDAHALLREVATQYYRVLAVKDEFEVARLYSPPAFMQSLRDGFEGDFKVSFHLAGDPFGKLDKVTGKIGKTAVGAWVRPAFRLLAGARFLRGSRLDPFARGAEAQLNRRVLAAYEADLDLLGHAAAQWPTERLQALLGWPASVRGYGHVRERLAQAGFAIRDRAREEWGGDASR